MGGDHNAVAQKKRVAVDGSLERGRAAVRAGTVLDANGGVKVEALAVRGSRQVDRVSNDTADSLVDSLDGNTARRAVGSNVVVRAGLGGI